MYNKAIFNEFLLLFQVNIFNTTTTNSPKADGLNAMQSWVICCIFFVFGALFEYAIILLQMKIKTFRKLAASMQKDETCAMDVAVLIAFPVVFLIFNIVYWAAFHLWKEETNEENTGCTIWKIAFSWIVKISLSLIIGFVYVMNELLKKLIFILNTLHFDSRVTRFCKKWSELIITKIAEKVLKE